jgi:hypothetical protein
VSKSSRLETQTISEPSAIPSPEIDIDQIELTPVEKVSKSSHRRQRRAAAKQMRTEQAIVHATPQSFLSRVWHYLSSWFIYLKSLFSWSKTSAAYKTK